MTNHKLETLRWQKLKLITERKRLDKEIKEINMMIAEEINRVEYDDTIKPTVATKRT